MDNLVVASLTQPFINVPILFFMPLFLKLMMTDVEDYFILFLIKLKTIEY